MMLAASTLSIGALSARTWTSSDGSKTFEGEFKSYDATTEKLTVLRGGSKMVFGLDKLSEEDREWVKAHVDELEKTQLAEAAAGLLAEQKIGAKLQGGVLSKLEDGKFVDYELTSAPEYYLVYFTASW